MELQGAGLMVVPGDGDGARLPIAIDLSARQQEVVSRLTRGERVPSIAKAMYLSQSTIRNHLTAIFRKAGVHSQEALLAHLRGRAVMPPPGETDPGTSRGG
jgi:DNA-binding NarL/FixJ family response regulator